MAELDDTAQAFSDLQGVYSALALHFHPDWRAIRGERHNSAPKAKWSQERSSGHQDPEGSGMSRLWDAYLTLRDPAMLAIAERSTPSKGGASIKLAEKRPPLEHECMFCGSSPALPLQFRSLRTSLFDSETTTTEGSMCGSCSQVIGKSHQQTTKRHGWLGLSQAATSLGYLRRNRHYIRQASKLGPPTDRDDAVIALLRAPITQPAALQSPRDLAG